MLNLYEGFDQSGYFTAIFGLKLLSTLHLPVHSCECAQHLMILNITRDFTDKQYLDITSFTHP